MIGTLDIGGTEGQLVQLVTHLDPRRFAPVVCSLSSGGPYLSVLAAAGIPVEIVGFRGFQGGLRSLRHLHKVAAQLSRLVHFMRQVQPAMVHGFLFWAYIIGTYAAKGAGVPIVIASRRGLGEFKVDKPHYLFLERLANRMTDLIVANSEAVKQDVVRREKVDPSKVRVVYNGIDLSPYDVPADPGLQALLGISARSKVIGVIANLIPYKGHRFFLQACQEIKRKDSGVKFLLVGDGPCRGELEGLARELGLEKDVGFLGSRRDIPQLLALMDVAVLPSSEEGFPNAILEAMAAGKPVVASQVGGVSEAVVDGETGFLVPAGDASSLATAIGRLLGDPLLGSRMGAAGRRRVQERFGLSRMVAEMEALYEERLDAAGH